MNKIMIYAGGTALLLVGLVMGYLLFSGGEHREHQHADQAGENTVYTCSMHPQIKQNEPGKCPLCEMDLIPADEVSGDEEFEGVEMTHHAMKLAEVQTSKVRYMLPRKGVRLNGKIVEDETGEHRQTAHFEGRIEQLKVKETGVRITKGDVVAGLYAPTLIAAQRELIDAYENRLENDGLYRAARQKLKNRKLTATQIDAIIERGKPEEQLPVIADASGIIVERLVSEGDYINKGQALFVLNNRERIWAEFDVYERDLNFVKTGDSMHFEVSALPGKTFAGKVSFINPAIDENTRSTKARLEVANKNGRLIPGMLATARAEVQLNNEEVLVVPRSAVLWTGTRSLVYIKTEKGQKTGFERRRVTLGEPLGDGYIITSGLAEGEEIVTRGTFSVDAAAQLAGKPSMINDFDRAGQEQFTVSKTAEKELSAFFQAYLKLKDELVETDFEAGQTAVRVLHDQAEGINTALFEGAAGKVLKNHLEVIVENTRKMSVANDIEVIRDKFKPLSNHVLQLAERFPPETTFYKQFCPMADDDRGAYWLSAEKRVANPYYGDKMLRCGTSEVLNEQEE